MFLEEFVVFFSNFVVCHFPVYLLGLNLEFEPTIQGELFLNKFLVLYYKGCPPRPVCE